jgi:hypothetical protein
VFNYGAGHGDKGLCDLDAKVKVIGEFDAVHMSVSEGDTQTQRW